MKTILRLTVCWFLLLNSSLVNCQSKMAPIKGGDYIPLYGREGLKVHVSDFLMDVYPITNEDFLKYVKEHPNWQRSKVIRLFADESYLSNWKTNTEIGNAQLLKSPVTNVSWFAAKNYCENQGKRLPTIDEWEYVAMSSETLPDARRNEAYNKYILSWYEKPKSFSKLVGSTFKNYWQVYDLHGLVWEWTSDFNSVLISGESRNDVDKNSELFCGSAAINATDLMNYAAFMRYAIRGSLKARYTMKNLGFRCVKDIK